MDVLEALKWRYAVKKFDENKSLDEVKVTKILKSVSLTATSMGMQLMSFIVTDKDQVKQNILPIAFNQPQIVDSSHLIILCRKDKVIEEDIEEIVNITSNLRDVEENQLDGYRKMLESTLTMNRQQQITWMENQVYLAMGNLLTICAVEKVDACPMEGFDRNKLDELLDLPNKGLRSVLMCPIGFRSDDDKYNGLPKIRRPNTKLIQKI